MAETIARRREISRLIRAMRALAKNSGSTKLTWVSKRWLAGPQRVRKSGSA